MARDFRTEEIAAGVWRIVDALEHHAYLVAGSERALLVDTCGGFGDLAACVRGLTDLPVEVALTHGHYDHVAGAYWFDEVRVSAAEGDFWTLVEDHAGRVHTQVLKEGLYPKDVAFAPRDGRRPRSVAVADGDEFALGGRTVRAVGLPGHTAGSMGYLVEDARLFLTGDAVTPIMCLFFDDSLDIEAWRQTLAKMGALPFDHFYTGHHDHAFAKADLAGFAAAGAYALTDRGMEWQHARLEEYRGILHLCPCAADDVDSPDFRAVIERWHELPARGKGRRARRAGR